VRPLLASGTRLLKPGGLILVEVADSRASEALALAQATPGLTSARILPDLENLPRVVIAQRTPKD